MLKRLRFKITFGNCITVGEKIGTATIITDVGHLILTLAGNIAPHKQFPVKTKT